MISNKKIPTQGLEHVTEIPRPVSSFRRYIFIHLFDKRFHNQGHMKEEMETYQGGIFQRGNIGPWS